MAANDAPRLEDARSFSADGDPPLSVEARELASQLERAGSLEPVRAQLQRLVFEQLHEARGPAPAASDRRSTLGSSHAEVLAASLVLDYLEQHGLENTLLVACTEASWPEGASSDKAATFLRAGRDRDARVPALVALVERHVESAAAVGADPGLGRPGYTPSTAAVAERTALGLINGDSSERAHERPSVLARPLVLQYSHAGGSGADASKVNQDAHFAFYQPAGASTRSVLAMGVFDGHGAEHGHVAARAACAFAEAFLGAPGRVAALEKDPPAVLRELFAKAHDRAVEAMALQPDVVTYGSGARALLLQRVVDEGGGTDDGSDSAEPGGSYLDVTDGGTTASIVLLVGGRWLYTAAVGDSSGLLVAADPRAGGDAAAAKRLGVRAHPLWRDHTPLSEAEFLRMRGQGALFVYDHPRLFDSEANQLPVWQLDRLGGRPRVGGREEARARADGVAAKSVRGELSTLILSPPSDKYSQIGLTVTRSLGDVYMHSFGVSPEPEVHVRDLLELAPLDPGGTAEAVLVVASDGVWDLWAHEDVARALWACDSRTFAAFCERTRAEGVERFGEASDNLTLIAARVTVAPDLVASSRRGA